MKLRHAEKVLVLLLAVVLLATTACNQTETDQAEEQLNAMEDQIASLQQELDAAKGDLEQKEKTELEEKISAMQSNLAETRKELKEARAKQEAEQEAEASTPPETASRLNP